ncbi:MAG: flagellar biosynthetic protein FliO [Candidatus Alkaliphilus sp. MAG34]
MYRHTLPVFLLLVAAVAIIIFAYYITTMVGKKMNRLLEGRYTRVLERSIIGMGTNITILKINQKIYIIMMQGKSVNLLDVIEEDNWKFLNNKNKTRPDTRNINNNFSVKELLNKIKKILGNNRLDRNGSDNDEQYKV